MPDETAVEESPYKEPQPTESGLGLLCDVELDATLQFGSREMSLRQVLEPYLKDRKL